MYVALKKRNVIKILGVVALAATIAVSVFLGVYFGKAEQSDNVGLETKSEQAAGLRLALSPLNAAANGETYSQSITATVLPEDAPDKRVDWSISWADDAPLKDSDISAYLTITPASDGATTATIVCKKKFSGSTAYVKCVTRVGKFESVCKVSFVNNPTTFAVDTSSLSTVNIQGRQVTCYGVGENGVTLPVKFSNPLDDNIPVTANVTCTLHAYGSITVANKSVGSSGTKWSDISSTITLESILSSLVSVNYNASTRTLSISPKTTVENYYESKQSASQGVTYKNHFKSLVAGPGGAYPMLEVRLSYVNITGEVLSYNVPFWIQSTVNGVTVNSSEIKF